ncbi:PH domain-containing protein [Palleronia sp.]|uniref:PH domain-containing protein n=1 Tax=Palleronia sp. TaxID=1940284 RepID=UPI0035C85AD4
MTWDGKKIVGLRDQTVGENAALYEFLLLPEEQVVREFKSVRDCLICTDRRVISIDVQGLRGKKKEFVSIAYASVTAFSVETAGTFDLDSELKIWLSGMGLVQFEFLKGADVMPLISLLSKATIGAK